MEYFDSGKRDEREALASWFSTIMDENVVTLRLQTGYFSIRAIGSIIDYLQQSTTENLTTKFLIGANQSSTSAYDVKQLFQLMGVPRSEAYLGIVNFNNALFHPKTYHITRKDGSQAAFVGSANLTKEGLTLNIEAGISLDTLNGDDENVLRKISESIDNWFIEARPGLTVINNLDILNELIKTGVLPETVPSKTIKQTTEKSDLGKSSSLSPLFKLPIVDKGNSEAAKASAIESSTLPHLGDNQNISAPSATAPTLTFGMTLQNTDVGIGQTNPSKSTQRRSPEIFIPMRAVFINPSFWGWYNKFSPDNVWIANNSDWLSTQANKPYDPLRPRIKVDWHNVVIKLVGQANLISASIWHNPIKNDIRIRAEQLRASGNIGDILLVRKGSSGSGEDFEVEMIPISDPNYSSIYNLLTVSIPNSKKRIGYF